VSITQIGNGDFPLNNCAILRQILPETSLDFMKTVLRGEAFANPIANLAGNVRNNIGSALAKIGTLSGPNTSGGGFFGEMSETLTSLQNQLVEFEARTNRMSGLIVGFQEGEPDMGRILGIGSAYNSALATLVTNPEELLKDNFSHGFNSLKQEFGVNAIQQSNTAVEAAGNFLAQFGLGFNAGDPNAIPPIPSSSFVDPSPAEFYNEAQQILGNVRTIQQSITNIINAEDAYLAGALAFLDQFALANTALSSVLSDPCMAGKVIKDLVASPDLTNLIPSLELPSLPSVDDILSQIPDPEDVVNGIKESVEGIAESVKEQVQQVIEETVEIGRETVEAIQKSAEDIIEAGEQIVEQAEQAAKDLATNVEEFGNDVDKFFEDLENRIEEATSDDEEAKEEESTGDITDETTDQSPVSANLPIKATQEPRTLEDVRVETALSYRSVARSLLDVYKNQQRNGGFTSTGLYDAPVEFLLNTFPLDQLEKSLAYIDAFPDDRNDFVIGTFGLASRLEEAIEIKKNPDLPEGANPGI